MPTAHIRAEAAINMTSGLFTVDFSDFAIAIPPRKDASGRHIPAKYGLAVSVARRAAADYFPNAEKRKPLAGTRGLPLAHLQRFSLWQ
jgi:hypothetical protein